MDRRSAWVLWGDDRKIADILGSQDPTGFVRLDIPDAQDDWRDRVRIGATGPIWFDVDPAPFFDVDWRGFRQALIMSAEYATAIAVADSSTQIAGPFGRLSLAITALIHDGATAFELAAFQSAWAQFADAMPAGADKDAIVASFTAIAEQFQVDLGDTWN